MTDDKQGLSNDKQSLSNDKKKMGQNYQDNDIYSEDNSSMLSGLEDLGSDESGETGRGQQGFASMSKAKQREIASKGGKAAHEAGTAHEWDSSEAAEAGRRGGQKKAA